MSGPLFFEPETESLRIQTRDIPAESMKPTTDQLQDSRNVSDVPTLSPSLLRSSSTSSKETTPFNTTDNGTYHTTQYYETTSANPQSGGSAVTMIAVIIVLVTVTAFLTLIYFYMRKKGKLTKLPCYKPVTRTRRSSSSSSRRALEEHEVMDDISRPKPEGQADDAFTINEYENPPDPQAGREEYYYDEVFGQSQFEDEATNNAMRQLYSDSQEPPEEEMLDFDFETLGIKIEDYNPDFDRKNTV